MLNTLGAEDSLRDVLIGCDIPETQKRHTKDQPGPRQFGICYWSNDRKMALWCCTDHRRPGEINLLEHNEGQQPTAKEQYNGLQSVGVDNRL